MLEWAGTNALTTAYKGSEEESLFVDILSPSERKAPAIGRNGIPGLIEL